MAVASGNYAAFTLQKHFEDTRSLVQCKICLRPLYEPFTIACGHTYCYSCLDSWFTGHGDRKRNRNCPDCRSVVRQQPSPNYLVRDLTHMIITRPELLPEDETVEDHQAACAEEAGLMVQHREQGGLFHGVFARPALDFNFDLRRIIRDEEDGVERCPDCAWEIEDGICAGCGRPFHAEEDGMFNFTTDETMSSDMDDSSIMSASEDDDQAADRHEERGQTLAANAQPLGQFAQNGPRRFYAPSFSDDSEAAGSESDDEDHTVGGETGLDEDSYDTDDDFIDNENEDDAEDLDVEPVDEDELDHELGHGYQRTHAHTSLNSDASTPYQSDDGEEASIPDQLAFPTEIDSWRRNGRWRERVILSEDQDNGLVEEEGSDNGVEAYLTHDEDEDDVVLRTRPFRSRRRRPVVDDDEDEEEVEDSHGNTRTAASSEPDDDVGDGVDTHDAATSHEHASSSDDEDGDVQESLTRASSSSDAGHETSDHVVEDDHMTEDSDDTALPPRQTHEARIHYREQQRKSRKLSEERGSFMLQSSSSRGSRRSADMGRRRRIQAVGL